MRTLEEPSKIIRRSPKRLHKDPMDRIQNLLGAILCVSFAVIAAIVFTAGDIDLALPWLGLSTAVCPWLKVPGWLRVALGLFCFVQV